MHTVASFQAFIWDFYHENGRDFAWRHTDNPYKVVISELMLQQTQTHRVIEKYEHFIDIFPDFESLAAASLRDVLSVWQGLGYYRRARYLHQLAQLIVEKYDGELPSDPSVLQTFPGIGPATASSIGAFAFNQPTVFIETNIRTVFIHTFFQNKDDISDKQLMPLISDTVDHTNPREWYYALMDYGVFLKNNYSNPNRKSAHYNKQTKFEGSNRQLRAHILKLITDKGQLSYETIVHTIAKEQERIKKIIAQLIEEKFIIKTVDEYYTIV
jgi:A/G-specific adenine glycosylase